MSCHPSVYVHVIHTHCTLCRVPENVLKANFSSVVRIISGALTKFGTTDDVDLLRSVSPVSGP